ncbi:MAG: hypothetical protein OXH60_12205 [Rhodospirillales bacterium]|nr:hypothetical protein [Rhodospirillales bacterium]
MPTKLLTAVFLGLALIVTAACSGSSQKKATADAETRAEQAETRAEEAETRAEQAETRAEDAETRAEQAETRAEDAETRAEDAETRAEDAETRAEDAEERAEDAQGAQQTAQQQQAELQEQLTEAERAELSARASSFRPTLDGPGMGSVTVEWPRGGSLTFRPAGTLTPGSAAPSVPGGWRSAGFTGQSGSATALVNETVYLYTNIQAPGNREFWKKYGGEDLPITQQQVTDGLVVPSTSVSRTRSDPNDPTSAYVSASTSGSYDGVGGRFSCTGDENACTVTRSSGATTIGGSWTFKATNLRSGAPVDQDDAYLYFGIWSSIPDGISGTYDFDYIAGGGAVSGSALIGFDTLTGSATFRGGAVGRYATLAGVGRAAKIGTFTATATLNVNFGAADAEGTLSGRLTDFREDGSSLTGWSVTLGSAGDVSTPAAISGAAVATVTNGTVANIGGVPVGGDWGATFHGSANTVTGLDDRTKYPAVDLAGVTGWFDATSDSASLAGAFAAKSPGN